MNYYQLLGVHKFSTHDELKAAWGKLAKLYHPDHHDNDPVLADKMETVNVAWNVLKNVKSRRQYDRELALFGAKCPACQGAAVTMKQKGWSRKVAVPCTACKGTGVL